MAQSHGVMNLKSPYVEGVQGRMDKGSLLETVSIATDLHLYGDRRDRRLEQNVEPLRLINRSVNSLIILGNGMGWTGKLYLLLEGG